MRVPPVFAAPFGARRRLPGGGRRARVLRPARIAGPMAWILAIMVALSVLAAGAALALANFTARSEAALAGGLTVQIVEADEATREARAAAAARALAGDRAVASVVRVPPGELARLVDPWLGTGEQSGAIVLPALIDVRLAPDAGTDALPRLRSALARVAPGARLDAQAEWLAPATAAIRALRWLAGLLIALLALASAAAVWLAARHAFDANRETIEIVHHLGAGDAQIARLFQRWVLTDAAIGGAVGLALGCGALLLVGDRFAALEAGPAGAGALTASDWLLIAAVPVILALVALFTARRTVLARLGSLL